MDFLFRGQDVAVTINSVKILHAVRSAITPTAELLVCADVPLRNYSLTRCIAMLQVQCDDCDAWYHTKCVGCTDDLSQLTLAQFHCGCTWLSDPNPVGF